ncbi:hypothetical protein SLS55_002377 [Diplodia seriata]|uniref:Uncharacterized protein n=1 Tax=Diplodia seriata TaxID=420778 RepID=A0ABR3CS09_9PEZI
MWKSLQKSTSSIRLGKCGSISIHLDSKFLDKRKHNFVRVELVATMDLIVEIAQQMSWLATALRGGLSGNVVSYSEATVAKSTSTESDIRCFHVSVAQRPLDPKEASCWFSLFDGAGIARGFPIPERESVSGLEISVDILAALAGARHAVEFEGGIILKGFSTMIVPTERVQERIRWHLVQSNDGKALTYEDGVKNCPNRLMIHEFDLNALRSTRAIVGWCSAVKLFLGSEAINYENLHYSGFHLNSFGQHLKLSGGTVGFSQLGVGQLNVAFGTKDGKCHFQRNNGPYQEIVALAEKLKVLLYDTSEKRAWLVPASHVVLHIAQARLQSGFFADNEGKIKLFSTDTSKCSARETLMRDVNNMIIPEENYRLKELVVDIWSYLDRLKEHKDPDDATPGVEPKINFRDELIGFEFRDIVQKESPCALKRCNIAKTNGGWVNLIHDIGALALFANGFEDLVRPSATCQTSLCRRWISLPKGEDYLAVPVQMLKGLYEVAGCPLDRKFLSNTCLQWHQSRSIFGPCDVRVPYDCGCNRLSQVVGKHAIGTVNGPGNLDPYDKGAVIFGQSGTLLQDICGRKHTPTKKLFSQENQDITFTRIQNDNGPSESSISDGGSSIQRSDASEGMTYSSISTVQSEDNITSLSEEKNVEVQLEAEQSQLTAVPGKCKLEKLTFEDSQRQENPAKGNNSNHPRSVYTDKLQLHHGTHPTVSKGASHVSRIPLPTQKTPQAYPKVQSSEASGHRLRRKHGKTNLEMDSVD